MRFSSPLPLQITLSFNFLPFLCDKCMGRCLCFLLFYWLLIVFTCLIWLLRMLCSPFPYANSLTLRILSTLPSSCSCLSQPFFSSFSTPQQNVSPLPGKQIVLQEKVTIIQPFHMIADQVEFIERLSLLNDPLGYVQVSHSIISLPPIPIFRSFLNHFMFRHFFPQS